MLRNLRAMPNPGLPESKSAKPHRNRANGAPQWKLRPNRVPGTHDLRVSEISIRTSRWHGTG
jgi:hypothetical protein